MARISPFRWRLEWALLLAVAVAGILNEQAREAQGRDPYALVNSGRTAQATLTSPREVQVPLGVRRGVSQFETHTLVDLAWQDDTGEIRRVTGYRLDPATAAGLRRGPTREWPATTQVQYLDRAEMVRPPRTSIPFISAQGTTAPAFQQYCEPWAHCRVVVLPADVLSPAEEDAQNVDYVLDRAPHAFKLCLLLLVGALALRLAGIIDNRPSLE